MRDALALLALSVGLTLSGCSSPRSGAASSPDATAPAPARGSDGGLGGASGAGGTAVLDAAAPSGAGGNAGAPGQGGSAGSSDAGSPSPVDVACPEGSHRCGADCVDARSVNSCGTTCRPCPTSPNGTAFCDGTKCGLACTAGFHLCGDACVSDTDPATCGTSCSPCPSAPANGVATCVDGRQCGFRCGQGFFRCAGQCKSTEATVCANISIEKIPLAQAPTPPAQRKVVCNAGPDTLDEADCPVVRWGDYRYWSLADLDNSVTTYIAAYDTTGRFIKQITKPGARYIWKVSFEDGGTLIFHGQGAKDVKASWAELRIDQPVATD